MLSDGQDWDLLPITIHAFLQYVSHLSFKQAFVLPPHFLH